MRKNLNKICLTILLVIITLFLIYRLFLVDIFFTTLQQEPEIKCFNNPNDCISYCIEEYQSLSDTEDEYSSYSKSVYIYETDLLYVEFYLSDNNQLWFYVLDKVNTDNVVKYTYSYSQTASQYDHEVWNVINNTNYYYRVEENFEEIDTYNGQKAVITNFSYSTAKQGEITKYLLFIGETQGNG